MGHQTREAKVHFELYLRCLFSFLGLIYRLWWTDFVFQWQRAEVLGALINGVFLLALCLSIFLEAVQRFFEPQEVGTPKLVLAVGSAGLASNILGLFLFHDHGHSHGGDDHGHSHSHAPHGDIEASAHEHSHGHFHDPVEDENGDITDILPATIVARVASGSDEQLPRSIHAHKRDKSKQARFASPVTHIHVHPARNRQEVIAAAVSDSEAISGTSDDDDDGDENTPLVPKSGESSRTPKNRKRSNSRSCHHGHNHMKPKPQSSSGHSHQNLNMRGVFLHVLGDALGNVGVMAVALCLMYVPAQYTWKLYLDPSISLVITVIIFASALPLVKSASKILLQAVPTGIALDDVKEDIADIPGVDSVHELHIWQLSDVKMIASLHIQITFDPDQAGRYMQLARAIRTCLHAYGIHSSTIQPEYTKPDVVASAPADGYGTVQDEAAACLLECGDGCETVKCCGPVSQEAGDGH